ncbi:UNVERIFIED_CONTAM: hypothetical protein FKN15_045763 [Acipenser sinensis]
MPAADGDSAGEEEDGSAGSDEGGWGDGLSDTSQLSDITASQRGKLYSLTEISDFLERTKGNRGTLNGPAPSYRLKQGQAVVVVTGRRPGLFGEQRWRSRRDLSRSPGGRDSGGGGAAET